MPMQLLQLIEKLVSGDQKISVLVTAKCRGGSAVRFFGEYVHYELNGVGATVHMNCFPRITEDVNAALQELGRKADYFLGYDAEQNCWFLAIPGERLFDSGPTPALAVAKVLVRRACAQNKGDGPLVAVPEEESEPLESCVN